MRVLCGEQVNALSALCRLMMMMMLLLLAATRRMLHIHTPRSPTQTKRNFQTLMENTLPLMQMRIAKCGMLIPLIRKEEQRQRSGRHNISLLRAIDFEALENAARPTKTIYTGLPSGDGWLELVQILLTLLSLILIIACQPNSRTVRQ